ncbi:MAG: YihA family ribosome biogenesis GTP-binding protein [Spirochaetes bacterium]|nr:YihA family ribosome biogenesis GTP-binding protein [Spirochaetota bacterium]
MRIIKADFVKSALKPEQYPKYNHPECAFIGKSNVGKSSLINMITNRKNLVKTGSKPGMTQMINFFLINDKYSFVDLPGYGFAKAPENVRKQFKPMIETYFKNRENLKIVFLLIDCRREVTDIEKNMITLLSSLKIPTAIIMTKTDKLTKNQNAQNTFRIADQLNIEKEWIIHASALKNTGKREIISLINEYSHTSIGSV